MELQTIAVALLVAGGVVLLVSLVGFLGACRENRLLLLVFIGFLVVLVLGQVFITLLLLFSRDKIVKTMQVTMDTMVMEYPEGERRHPLDNVQHYAGCCGRTGPSDWLKNPFVISLNLSDAEVLPCSCFSSYRRSSNSSFCSETLNVTSAQVEAANHSFTQGCDTALSDWLKENFLTIVGMNISLIFIQVVQVSLAVGLFRSFGTKRSVKSLGQPEPFQDQGNWTYSDEDQLYQDQIQDYAQ